MIQVEHLSKSFGDFHVIKDITVNIEKGEVISIIGPSGTGKSTFLRCLNLLERPTGGKIIINGVNILDKKADVPAVRKKMGMVFQSFNLFEHLSIMENLLLGQMKLLGRTRAEAEKRGMELLQMVGLSDKALSYPSELSGGQKQRIAIARCLTMDPEIILFDEPTSALDPTMVSEVLGVIRSLARTGITMLIVTHEMNFAKDVSTRVFYMDEGGVYEDGAPEVIFGNPTKEKTRLFINRIRCINFHFDTIHHDLYKMNADIEAFGSKYYFTQKRVRNIMHLAEELLQIMHIEKGVDMDIEYSEKNDVVYLRATQHNFMSSIMDNPDNDPISMSMIKGLSSSIEEKIVDNSVKIIIS